MEEKRLLQELLKRHFKSNQNADKHQATIGSKIDCPAVLGKRLFIPQDAEICLTLICRFALKSNHRLG
jgi:hypothetical protein